MGNIILRDELEEILNIFQDIVSGTGQQELIVNRNKCVTQQICTFWITGIKLRSISTKLVSKIYILCNQAGKKVCLFPRIKLPPWKKTIAGIVLIGDASPAVSGG